MDLYLTKSPLVKTAILNQMQVLMQILYNQTIDEVINNGKYIIEAEYENYKINITIDPIQKGEVSDNDD